MESEGSCPESEEGCSGAEDDFSPQDKLRRLFSVWESNPENLTARTQLIDASSRYVPNFVRQVTRSFAPSSDFDEDVSQQTLLRLLERLDHLPHQTKNYSALLYWLVRSATKEQVRAEKRRGKEVPLEAIAEPAARRPESRDLLDKLSCLFTKHNGPLSPQEIEILRMWAHESMNHKEIAKSLDCSHGAARKRFHKVIEKLRRILGEDGDSDPSSPSE